MNKVEKVFIEMKEKYGINILNCNDIQIAIGLEQASVNLYLRRLSNNQRIKKIATGIYALSYINWNWGELIRKISTGSYITGLWVLQIKGIYIFNVKEISGKTGSNNRKI